MASLAQNVRENSHHEPWNKNNTEIERGRQSMMGNTKVVYAWLRP